MLAHLRNHDPKQAEVELFRARWYYARLYEGAAGEPEEATELAAPWGAALARLEMILTNEELVRIREAE